MNKHNDTYLHIKKLANLDRKIEEIDEALKNVRIEINNIFWNIRELKQKNITGR
ncbi:MAG: hypothetical protein Q8P29_04525 [Candidatus Levybacteria bacterium]|nr:hypothetical protein [Candidatus Levybacteria bacterium]